MNIFDAYPILGCNRRSTDEEIKQAHRRLSREYHPDKGGGNPEEFDKVQKAFNMIKNAKARSVLFTQLSSMGDECSACAGRGVRILKKGWVQTGTEPCGPCHGVGYVKRTR